MRGWNRLASRGGWPPPNKDFTTEAQSSQRKGIDKSWRSTYEETVMSTPEAEVLFSVHSVLPESGVKELILAQGIAGSFAILVRMWWAKFSI
jgi:hypothetical protein